MVDKSLESLIAERRKKYDVTKNINCPFLKEIAYFNNKGFHYATHDGRGKLCNLKDARMRLNLLTSVNQVIAESKHFGSPPRVKSKGHPDNRTGKELVEYELSHKFSSKK